MAEKHIQSYAEANFGIAVGIGEGLIIPVVRDCHTKTCARSQRRRSP